MNENRWQRFGTSIFTTMTQASIKAGAVNLAQGFPDFDGPEPIKAAAIEAIRNGLNQYAPSAGLPELRELLAERQEARSGVSYDPASEVTVFSGATEALFVSMLALLGPGDEIIAFEPFYDSYPAGAFAAQATFRTVRLEAPDWSFDPAALKAAVTPRTKAIIVNTPHNPTGKVYSKDELTVIANIAKEHDLIVITDEVYEELVFAPAKHTYLASLPGMRERTVTISSTSKTFSMTGWKIGYAFAPAHLSEALRAVHQFTVFCSATPLQAGMCAALKLTDEYFRAFRREYAERREALSDMLNSVGFKARKPDGSYFITADYSELSDRVDREFALWLTSECKVAAIPISVFYQDPEGAAKSLRYLRFGFCKDKGTIRAAGVNLSRHLKQRVP